MKDQGSSPPDCFMSPPSRTLSPYYFTKCDYDKPGRMNRAGMMKCSKPISMPGISAPHSIVLIKYLKTGEKIGLNARRSTKGFKDSLSIQMSDKWERLAATLSTSHTHQTLSQRPERLLRSSEGKRRHLHKPLDAP